MLPSISMTTLFATVTPFLGSARSLLAGTGLISWSCHGSCRHRGHDDETLRAINHGDSSLTNTFSRMNEKTRFDLIPFAAIGEIADVLAYGANKYEANNWARGTAWGRYFAALCRHLFSWWRGEDRDPETGFSHLAHAGCCLLFLMEYQRNDWGTDDRFRGPDGDGFIKHDGRGG